MEYAANYNIIDILNAWKELKELYWSILNKNYSDVDDFSLNKDDHKNMYKKIKSLVEKTNIKIGNNQFYMSMYQIIDYKKEINLNSNIKQMNHSLWLIFNETKETLNQLKNYELMN